MSNALFHDAPRVLLGSVLAFLAACSAARDDRPLTFVASSSVLDSANSQCVAAGDIDSDGDTDILVANDDSASALWINNGAEGLTDAGRKLPSASCVVVADVDADGDRDAILTGNRTVVLVNDGLGNLSNAGEPLLTEGAAGAALGDLDGDGDLDMVVARWGHPTGLPNQVWLNQGDGMFELSSGSVGNAVSIGVDVGDVDADGDLDVLVANQADANHDPIPDELWLNDGAAHFTDSGLRLGNSSTYVALFADLDSDGDLDVFAANSSHAGKSEPANRVWFNDGEGNLLDSGQRLGNAYSLSVALRDVDGDGDLDAYVGNYLQADRVWLNDGSGQFADSGLALGSQNGHGVVFADLDGDSDLDAFVANNTWQGGDGKNRVWLNTR